MDPGLLTIRIFFSAFVFVLNAIFRNIIIFESIFVAFISGVYCWDLWSIHPAFCLLIGIGVFLLLLYLQYTKVGFWLISGAMSLAWAGGFGYLIYSKTNNDLIWGIVVFGLTAIFMIGLHYNARSKIRQSAPSDCEELS